MGLSPGQAAFKLAFQLSPIILANGIAGSIPGGMLPIISITEALNFTLGLLSGNADIDLDNFFANFEPLPGSTLIDQQIGKYPFANQQVAANAVIVQPLTLSLKMNVSVREDGGYAAKLATMTNLKYVLSQHNLLGGTYIVATPSYLYTDLVMLELRDISDANSKQRQNTYQWIFEQPLLTLAQAAQAQNSMMSQITNGVPTTGALSGLPPTVGSPQSLAAPSVVPAAQSLPGAGVSGLGGIT